MGSSRGRSGPESCLLEEIREVMTGIEKARSFGIEPDLKTLIVIDRLYKEQLGFDVTSEIKSLGFQDRAQMVEYLGAELVNLGGLANRPFSWTAPDTQRRLKDTLDFVLIGSAPLESVDPDRTPFKRKGAELEVALGDRVGSLSELKRLRDYVFEVLLQQHKS